MTAITYTPGESTAVIGERAWMLLHTAPDASVVSAIWQHMEAADSVERLIGGLLAVGLEEIPAFALFADFGQHRHVLCRGQGVAQLIGQEGAALEHVDGQGLATWSEHRVDTDVRRVVLGCVPETSALQLPASAGVFLASSVSIDTTALGSRRVKSAARKSRRPAPEPAPSAAPVVLPVQAAAPPVASPTTEPVDGAATINYLAVEDDVAPAAVTPVAVVAAALPEVDGVDGETGYDFLFSATQARTVEGAAVRPEEPTEVDEPFVSAAPLPPSAPAAAAVSAPATTDSSGLIDAVPWADPEPVAVASPAEAVTPSPTPSVAAHDADDGSTIKRGDLLKLTSRGVAADKIGPTVHALLCPVSHANPPNSSFCRLCGASLPQQDPVTVPRPVLGVLRLSTGDVIALDRGVVMGRSPRTEFDGEERPHVVKLPSADGEISRTHLQVTLDGWHVLVTDLKSTNGTLVTLPGREPEQLRPQEPLPIQPGTVVTLADGVDFRYEVAE